MEPKKLVHGGDWAGFAEEYGTAPLDFSANVSPLGAVSYTHLTLPTTSRV